VARLYGLTKHLMSEPLGGIVRDHKDLVDGSPVFSPVLDTMRMLQAVSLGFSIGDSLSILLEYLCHGSALS
jgi:hypothetical protein